MENITEFARVNVLLITNAITLAALLFLILRYKTHLKVLWKIAEPNCHYKARFLKIINRKGNLLDVGCGNDSPYNTKTKYPDITYTGIDIGDYNQTTPNLADEYIVVKPEGFAEAIENMAESFDAVISAHNLEHCNDRDRTLDAMIKALKPGGYLFLSFPTEKSVDFPGPRKGTLNYYDDPTHKDKPPDYEKIISTLKTNNMKVLFANKSYKPFPVYIVGFLLERESKKTKEVLWPWTWGYWGFETIIWGQKVESKNGA
ncbi:MAG: class I SAM-dependent methyltransferase [Spirochaetaceae bacterium]|nr:class I SAM-dependent methyltransferase [Spirochaetaceae bacterium]